MRAGPDETGWRLEFWSVATPHLRTNRYTLHNWTVTCEGDDVAWWATPEWTTPDDGWATAGLRIVT